MYIPDNNDLLPLTKKTTTTKTLKLTRGTGKYTQAENEPLSENDGRNFDKEIFKFLHRSDKVDMDKSFWQKRRTAMKCAL